MYPIISEFNYEFYSPFYFEFLKFYFALFLVGNFFFILLHTCSLFLCCIYSSDSINFFNHLTNCWLVVADISPIHTQVHQIILMIVTIILLFVNTKNSEGRKLAKNSHLSCWEWERERRKSWEMSCRRRRRWGRKLNENFFAKFSWNEWDKSVKIFDENNWQTFLILI